MATIVPWITTADKVVGSGHPTLPDVANRVLRYILTKSGIAVDTTGFTGLTPVFNVLTYDAVGDNTTDDGPAFQLAVNAAQNSPKGGIVLVPPGTYRIATTVVVNKPTVSLYGSGSGNTAITAAVSGGDAFKFQMSPFTVTQAGLFGRMTITGTSGANRVGLHMVDVIGMHLDDLVINGFTGTGGTGIWMQNVAFFIERTLFTRVHCDANTIGLRMTGGGTGLTNSFGYTKMVDYRANAGAGQTALVIDANAILYNSTITMMCNVVDAGTVVSMLNTAAVTQCSLSIHAEQTTGVGGVGIRVAAGAVFNGYGVVSTAAMGHVNGNSPSQAASLRIYSPGGTTTGGSNLNAADHGTIANYLGSGITASPVLVGADKPESPQGGVGIATGAGLISPFVVMYDAVGNAFSVGKLAFGAALNAMVSVMTVGLGGLITTIGGVSAGGRFYGSYYVPPYSATIAIDASQSNYVIIIPTNSTAFTISTPTNPPSSSQTQRLTFQVRMNFAGACGAITFGAQFVLAGGAAFVGPSANAKRRTITFDYDGGQALWVESARTTADT